MLDSVTAQLAAQATISAKFIFTLRKAMLFGAVVGAVLAIAELRQLDEVASGTELGSGADNGFLEPPIARRR